ncbi:Gfo/Idh/MocA family protein [Pedobacter sp. L105]|uniref:Gfo/Idh/MocA family protein n=1 Tax=Pedobacter sp. L105 TaxID=1641871 RepID=UPI00131A88A9|nr:Gfo/Idh/MocA family oxidoreductase [Pedobacter sp. L105]
MNRREFVNMSSMAAAVLTVMPEETLFANPKDTKVKIAIIGVGNRGQDHIKNLMDRTDIELVAICDIDQRMLDIAKGLINKSGNPMPEVFTGDDYAWKKLLRNKNIQCVLIATPWEWHKPMIIGAIEAGIKYVATEVILGITLEDHWDVVHAAEKYNAQVMMLENVCYRRDVLAVLNMVRQGIFGEIIHLQGGYQHDLREVKFNNGIQKYGGGVEFNEKGFSEARWRTNHSVHRNGDLYPTHGIGPIAQCININRGNRFLKLSSFATKSRGLHKYIVDHGGESHPNAKVNFRLGDIVTTTIVCANGETIILQHDTNSPRPYSLGFRVQGTDGLWMEVSDTIFIEGVSKPHVWDSATAWLEKYDHPLWKKYGKAAESSGHGGIDFFVINAFIEAVKHGAKTPMDVYDAATWSAIAPLSEQSIELGNETVDFPDFTSGKWMYSEPSFALNDAY